MTVLRGTMLVGLLVLTGALATAETLTPTTPDTLVLTVLSVTADNTVIGYDLRGTAGTTDGVETVYITDGDPYLGLPAPPDPNIFLAILNAALTESGLLQFGTPALGGDGLLQTASFTPFTTITDPALAGFVNFPPLVFDWSFTGTLEGAPAGETLSTWQLVEATSSPSAVPEPASIALLGLGIVSIGLIRKRLV